jgi:hypothetical protein
MKLLKKKKKKQRVIRLNLDRTLTHMNLTSPAAGKVKDPDTKQLVNFSPECIFEDTKKKRFTKTKRFIMYVEGTTQALKFKEVPDPDPDKPKLAMNDFNPFWTIREAKEFVDKQVSLAIENMKPMTMWQFAFVIILLIAILGAVVFGFNNIGGF